MKHYQYSLPRTNLIFGEGTLKNLGIEVKKLGKKALLVTGTKSMKKLGFLEKAINSLKKEGIEIIHYSGITPNPTVKTVNYGAEKALANDCDVVVALGGGSVMDTAKNIAVVAGHSEKGVVSIWEFSGLGDKSREITTKTLPVVAITSTSGTGSHVNRFAVVTNEKTREKTGIMSPFIYPRLSLTDLDILCSMPPSLTARTGFDVLSHVMECFVSKESNSLTGLHCLKAMQLVFNYLPQAYNEGNNIKAREAMALADILAGWALTTSRVILPHALSHAVSAFYPKAEHGLVLAALTPQIMRFNIDRGDEEVIEKHCEIAKMAGERIMSSTKKEAFKSVGAVERLLEKLKLNVTLQNLGVEEENLEGMVESIFTAMKGPIEANPVLVTRKEILHLMKLSFQDVS
jgi:alcohol dehydrogenase class IV